MINRQEVPGGFMNEQLSAEEEFEEVRPKHVEKLNELYEDGYLKGMYSIVTIFPKEDPQNPLVYRVDKLSPQGLPMWEEVESDVSLAIGMGVFSPIYEKPKEEEPYLGDSIIVWDVLDLVDEIFSH